MPIETANYINTLDPNLPATTDDVGQSDDHVPMIKRAIKATWPNITELVTATAAQINSPFPIGGIIMFAGSTAPTGWALWNGQTTTLADGSGTITTPDLRDRFIIGAGTIVTGTVGGSVALTASTSSAGGHSHSASTDAQGAHSHGGGTAGHALSVEELAPHVHGYVAAIQGAGGSSGLYTPSPANVANQGRATGPMGSGAPHNHGIALDGTHAHNVSVSAVGDHTHGHGHRRSAAVLRPRGHPQALVIIRVRNIIGKVSSWRLKPTISISISTR